MKRLPKAQVFKYYIAYKTEKFAKLCLSLRALRFLSHFKPETKIIYFQAYYLPYRSFWIFLDIYRN